MIIPRLIILRIRNLSDEVVEKIRTHILGLITSFCYENRAVYEIILKKNIVDF